MCYTPYTMLHPLTALYSWGYGIDGRLGLTEAEGRLLPELVSALSGVSVKGVAAGRWHSLARTADGALYSWGGGGFGRLGHGDEARLRLPNPNPNPNRNEP